MPNVDSLSSFVDSLSSFSDAGANNTSAAPLLMMRVPQVFSGELFESHVARMMTLNGFSDRPSLESHLREEGFLPETTNPGDLTSKLAELCGLSWRDYFRQHTLLPFEVSIHWIGSTDFHPFPKAGLHSLNEYSARLRSKPLRYCPDCIRQDALTVGIAYWHRDHQRPGAAFCELHRRRLLPNSTHSWARAAMPSTEPSQSDETTVGEKCAWSAAHEQAIREYMRLQQLVFASETTYPIEVMKYLVEHVAQGPTVEDDIHAPAFHHLADRVWDRYPPDWLVEHFAAPSIRQAGIGNWLHGRWGQTRGPRQTLAWYLVWICALFESAAEAFDALELAADRVDLKRATRRFWISDEKLNRYGNAQGSASMLAEDVDAPHSAVVQGLQFAGLPDFDVVADPDAMRNALMDFASGHSRSAVTSRWKIDETALDAVLRTCANPIAIELAYARERHISPKTSPNRCDPSE